MYSILAHEMLKLLNSRPFWAELQKSPYLQSRTVRSQILLQQSPQMWLPGVCSWHRNNAQVIRYGAQGLPTLGSCQKNLLVRLMVCQALQGTASLAETIRPSHFISMECCATMLSWPLVKQTAQKHDTRACHIADQRPISSAFQPIP